MKLILNQIQKINGRQGHKTADIFEIAHYKPSQKIHSENAKSKIRISQSPFKKYGRTQYSTSKLVNKHSLVLFFNSL